MSSILDFGSVIEGVGKVADDLFTSDEERLKVALQEKQLEAEVVKGQLEINEAEAQHKSVFVAGWRPFIGWIGGCALAYQFLLYPLLTWGWAYLKAKAMIPPEFDPPKVLDADALWVVVTGMLGIAGMRSFDKWKGVQTDAIRGR